LTTLSIAVAKKVDGHWLLASFSLGDGCVGIWDGEAGKVTSMCAPDSGEYAGQTRFLTMEEVADESGCASRVFFDIREDFTAFVAMTDGITDPKFETDAGLADTARWRNFWENDLTPTVPFSRNDTDIGKRLLDWMDFWSRGNHDDRTLAVMVPKDPEDGRIAKNPDEGPGA